MENATPSWELTWEEIIYPIEFRSIDFYVHLKPYRPAELKLLLRAEYNFRSSIKGNFAEILNAETVEASKEFFNKHFLKFSGLKHGEVELSSEDILKWVKAKIRGMEEQTVQVTFGGIISDAEDSTDDLFNLDATENVVTYQSLCIPPENKSAKLIMTHRLGIEERHYRRYQQATSQTMIDRKKGVYERPTNHDVIEQMYDQAIQTIDGMTMNGKPLLESEKDQWAVLVPYWHKLLVMRRVMQEVESKN